MSLSIGTLVGYLQLDDSNFSRKADAADKKMSALQLQLKALSQLDPKLKINADEATAKLEALKARVADLKAKAAEGVDVRVEMVKALTELDLLQAKIREVSRRVDINIGTADAEAKLTLLGLRVDWLKGKLDFFGKIKGPGLLGTAIMGLGPMLFALGGAATLGFGAITAGALSAVAGIGVLKLALKDIGPGAAAYKAYQQALTKADQSYATSMAKAASSQSVALRGTSTTWSTPARVSANKAYANAQNSAALQLAQARQNAQTTLDQSAYGSLSPQARAFVQFDINKLQPVTTGFKQSAENSVLPGLQHGLAHAIQAAPLANAAIASIGGAVGDMAAKAGKALNDPFWRNWISWLGRSASKDIPMLGSAAGHMLEGIARAIKKFSPDGHSMLAWIDGLAKKFDHWTTANGFTKFLDTVHKDGAQVASTLGALWKVLGPFLSGAATAGFAEWKVFGTILSGIASLPTGFIKFLGEALPVIILGLKGMQIVNSVAKGIKAMGVAMGILDAAMDANIISLVVLAIVALAAGLIYAYEHSKTFRDIVNGAFKAIGDAASFMWNDVLKPVFKLWLDGWLLIVGALVHGAAAAFGWIPGLGPKLKAAAAKFDQFRDWVNGALDGIHKDIPVKVTVQLSGSKALAALLTPGGSQPQGNPADMSSFQSLFFSGVKPKAGHHPHVVPGAAPRADTVFTGPITINQPHNYQDVQRNITHRRQMAALGGVG
jgi:hypothetical protein